MDVPHVIAGRFRIECEIGKGGMGTVYRATHLGLERPVAVKIIKPEFASDPHVTERFMREARTMAKLKHPHAAMIFDAGHLPDGRHFIVMEFVKGETLSETLAREGRFTPERAVRIACDICDVLSEAHRLGIVHRDLKPSNIMMGARGVCVLDFGVAKILATSPDATATHATTGSGVIVGTPRYMSPEQCLGQKVGARSDLYSLGVLVYEMLAGRPPFTDALASAVLVKQATAPVPPLPKLREDVPRPLAVVVHTLLAKLPERRPISADAARILLEKSVARPARAAYETSPFNTTVTALGAKRSAVFRSVTPVVMIATLGAMLFVWGRGAESMNGSSDGPRARARASESTVIANTPTIASAIAARNAGAATPAANVSEVSVSDDVSPQPVSLREARRLAKAISRGSVQDVRVLRVPNDTAIAAVREERRGKGASQLFVMERIGDRYRVAARAPLGVADFRGADWTSENLDVDGDKYQELLYTGTKVRGRVTDYRFVLYVPRTRQTYTLRVKGVARGDKRLQAVWSPNALVRAASLYRAALQQRVRTAVATRERIRAE